MLYREPEIYSKQSIWCSENNYNVVLPSGAMGKDYAGSFWFYFFVLKINYFLSHNIS